MSAKTKIIVVHMKELILTGIIAAVGILLIFMFVLMFLPKKNEDFSSDSTESTPHPANVSSDSIYIPGLYTTELVLGGNTVEIELIVNEDEISSVRLVNLSEAVATMYPLLQPAFDSLSEQIYKTQSLEGITYTSDSKYTSLVLLEAIRSSLNKAQRAQ